MKNLLLIENDGQTIVNTNFFNSVAAKAGIVYCSVNQACFRLLIPQKAITFDTKGTQYVVVNLCRGMQPVQPARFYLMMFEDNSQTPYTFAFSTEQADRIVSPQDSGRTDLRCIGYDHFLRVIFDLPARFRIPKRGENPLAKWEMDAPAMTTAEVVEDHIGEVVGKHYHSPLPSALLKWYRYTGDGGHSIKVLLKPNVKSECQPKKSGIILFPHP